MAIIAGVSAIAAVLGWRAASRSAAAAERSEGHAERSADAAERSASSAERSEGHAKRSADAAEGSERIAAETLEIKRTPCVIADHDWHNGQYGWFIKNIGEGTAHAIDGQVCWQDDDGSGHSKSSRVQAASLTKDQMQFHQRRKSTRYADIWGSLGYKDASGRRWHSEKKKGGQWIHQCEGAAPTT